jgi:predicted Zn-dependent peptidase
MLKLDEREAGLLRSAHLYADNDGVAFNGHNMILLLAKIDKKRAAQEELLEAISDALDEQRDEEIRRLLAEYFNG